LCIEWIGEKYYKVRIAEKSFVNVAMFMPYGRRLTNENCMQDKTEYK
jgi:hypothetical protein